MPVWYALDDIVTVLHGTTEAQLSSIRTHGLAPPPDVPVRERVASLVGEIMAKNGLSSALADATLIDRVIARTPTVASGLLDDQQARGDLVFAVLAPDSNADFYAIANAEHGGELARSVHEALEAELGRPLQARFAGSRPVVLEIEVPASALGDLFSTEAAFLLLSERRRLAQEGTLTAQTLERACRQATRTLGGAGGEVTISGGVGPEAIKSVRLAFAGADAAPRLSEERYRAIETFAVSIGEPPAPVLRLTVGDWRARKDTEAEKALTNTEDRSAEPKFT